MSSGPRIVGRGLCPEILVTADIGGVGLSFTELVSGKTSEEIDARLDAYTDMINRQRARVFLTEALSNLRASLVTLKEMPDKHRAYLVNRADQRIQLVASYEAAHRASNRRSDFELGPKHRQALAEFDTATDKHVRENFSETLRKGIEERIPEFEAKVAHNRAIIAGTTRNELLEDALSEAAD